jgi:4-nitrophenyl phosphatase
LKPVRAVILDMDGVLWRGNRPLAGLRKLFDTFERRSLPAVIATNNATIEPASVAARLKEEGVLFPPEKVVTSADAAAAHVARSFPAGVRVHVVGEEPLRAALTKAGCQIVSGADHPEAVIVGMDRRLDWEKLMQATLAIRAGAAFIGTNPDRTFPSERGIGPGNGAILAALEAATGTAPTVVGKPEPHLFLEAARRLAVEVSGCLVVGDRLETDILGGRRAGMPTALLLTGVTSREGLQASEIHPDVVLEDLPELSAWLSTLA